MAFQVSVTHWFLLTPFCHQAAVVSRRGEGRTAREEGAGAEKMEGIHGASRSRGWRGEWEPQGWPRGLWREDGMKGKGPFWTQAILNPVKSSLHMNLRVANFQRCEHVSGPTEEPEPLPPTSRVTETAARPPSPAADDPRALPSPTSSSQEPFLPAYSRLAPQCQLLYCTFQGTAR